MVPITKQVQIQRDTDLRFVIGIMEFHGIKSSKIYETLSSISGLKPDYIKNIRYQKENDNQSTEQ